jgi:hypothetical protein
MRTTKKLLMMGTAVFLALAALADQAVADQPVYDAANVSATNTVNASIGSLDANETANTTAIIAALKLLSGQNSLNSQGAIQADNNINGFEDTRRVQALQEQATYNALNQAGSGSSGCNMITGDVGAQNLENMVSQLREQNTQAQLDYYLGNSTNSASHNGRQAAVNALISSYCSTQATQADVSDGLCSAVAPGGGGSSETQPGGAGVTAAGVPDAVNADVFLNSTNGAMSPSEIAGANQYLAFISPAPVGPLPNNAGSSQEGRNLAYARLQNAAQISPAYDVLSDIISRETPSAMPTTSGSGSSAVNSSQELANWAQATAANTLGYTPTNGQYFPNGVSYDAYLQLRAKSWAMGPNFLGNLNSESEPQVMKDLVTIEGFRAQQGWEEYHMMEENNVLLASILDTLKSENRGN